MQATGILCQQQGAEIVDAQCVLLLLEQIQWGTQSPRVAKRDNAANSH